MRIVCVPNYIEIEMGERKADDDDGDGGVGSLRKQLHCESNVIQLQIGCRFYVSFLCLCVSVPLYATVFFSSLFRFVVFIARKERTII